MPRRHTPCKIQRYQPPSSAAICESKRRFPTKKQAELAAETQILTDMRLELQVYHCPHCRAWHLTRQADQNNS